MEFRAVLQRVLHRPGLVRQLALLAQRHEAGGELVGDRAAEDEAARLDAGHLVDLHARERLHQFVHRPPERPASPSRVVMSRNMIPGSDSPGWCG